MKEGRRGTNQEHDSNVQSKSDRRIGNEVPHSNAVDVMHGHLWNFKEQGSDTVHNETCGSEVVKRHEGVHLELGGAEKSLNHDQTDRLEDSSKDLVYLCF
jgi:hypothetical protein